MNRNKKALGVMLGTLVFLLVLAVVLLSVIIVSLAKEDKPVITTVGKQSVQSSQPSQTSDRPSTGVRTTDRPQTSDKPATSSGTGDLPSTVSTPSTSVSVPATSTPSVDPKPPVQGPNVAIGKIETVENADGSIVRKGAFRDDGETSLHIVIGWEAKYASKDATTVNLTVRVYLQCYSIGVAARNNGTLTINGESTTYSSPKISYDGKEQHYTLLTAKSVTISKKSAAYSTEVDLDAAWNYKGTYSGVPIEWLTVAGTIEV